MKKRTLNPVYNESFVFDLPSTVVDLQNVCIEFCVFDHDRVTKNEVSQNNILLCNSMSYN